MPQEEFEKLHEMFQSLHEEMKRMLQRAPLCYGEEKKRLMKDFSGRYREAEEMLREMDEALLDVPAAFRNPMSSKLRCYRRDIIKLQRDMKSYDLSSGFSGWLKEGQHGAYTSHRTQLQSQRVLLLLGTESLHHATQSIKRSQHIAAESEHIGSDIVEELGEQREQLDRTRDRLIQTGEDLSRSRRIMRSISRRVMTNKMLLSLIILMEIGILGAVVYLKFFHK
ncbi:vesicle transport through interaction with t-SNAREs homolog 1B [Scleropages formosus]|uniref:vesicle transport through interaction with t-SNAREs homolog 1B n=1 Tax=Scleropages formosus TaxID=113540 RepID=UPI0008784E5E|nr:vesicle transport through interaction with t-SNAREs homolog 1B [Scleropages formosus]